MPQHWTQPFTMEEMAWIAERWATDEWPMSETAKDLGASVGRLYRATNQFSVEMGTYPFGKTLYEGDTKRAAKRAAAIFREKGGVPNFPGKMADEISMRMYGAARAEHAWLLRCEGTTLRKIGLGLGVSGNMARILVWRFGRRVGRSMRRTKFFLTAAE